MAIDDRRHKTRKIIKKRIKISKECFGGVGMEQPHRLHKWNFTCDCFGCRNEKGDKIFKNKKLDQVQE